MSDELLRGASMTNEPSNANPGTQGKDGTYWVKYRPTSSWRTLPFMHEPGANDELDVWSFADFAEKYPAGIIGRRVPSPDELERIGNLLKRFQWIEFDRRTVECGSCRNNLEEGHAPNCEHVAVMNILTSPQGEGSGK